ncbi:putative reactive intermediate deaminase TdcF [subsurface metagenome]
MKHKIIETDGAPKAIGPYSQAVKAGDFLFASGQVGLDPASGKLVGESIEDQTRKSLVNLKAILTAGGAALEDVVETTIFLTDIGDYATVNRIYSGFMGGHKPARVTVQVAALPLRAKIEIKMTAFLG